MRILLLGDLILDEPDPDAFFEPSRELLRSADLVVGQVEVPHTGARRAEQRRHPGAAGRPGPPRCARAGRARCRDARRQPHRSTRGPTGSRTRSTASQALGIATAGAGMNLERGTAPGGRDGRASGVLCYNCVGPRESRATHAKAGCAPRRRAHPLRARLCGPRRARRGSTRSSTPESLDAMRDDILALRESGRRRRRRASTRASATSRVARARLRARARARRDRLRRRHRRRPPRAHPPRRRGLPRPPVFHGLGNFVTVTRALTPTTRRAPASGRVGEAAARAVRLRPRPGDAVLSLPPREPEHDDRRLPHRRDGAVEPASSRAGSTTDARPVPLGEADGAAVVDYVEAITREAGLTTAYRWGGDRVVCA